MRDYSEQIKEYINLEVEILNKIDIEDINLVMNEIEKAYHSHNKIYIFGNGGSAATASHFSTDFNKGVSEKIGT